MVKIILNGAKGRMGAEIIKRLNDSETSTLAAGIDINAVPEADGFYKSFNDYSGDGDVIIDFSNHACTIDLLEFAKSKKIACVVATTGHSDEEKAAIFAASKEIPVFFSANMSIGVAVLADFARRAAELMPDADIEIIEKHHNQKLDAPSGTALMLAGKIKDAIKNAVFICGRNGHAKRMKNEIGIHAVRLGNVVGEHEVIFNTGDETITLKHEAHSRALFANGAITAAEFLNGKPAGLYNMDSIVAK